MPTPPPIAIVGAGLAGLTCARALHARGVPLHIFDKGRGPGGRMSTRRHAEALRFDHGAQYVTARSEAFRAQLQRWVAAGVAAPWRGRVRVLERGEVSDTRRATERYVGVPGMSALVSHQARGLEVAFGTRVAPLERDGARWRLRTTGGEELGEFERVVIAVPAPQAAALLPEGSALRRAAEEAVMNPCWAALAAWDAPLGLPFDGAFVHRSPLAWIARDSDKPERPEGSRWVLHASHAWSRDHLERERDEVAALLLQALRDATPRPIPEPTFLTAHRWRYAIPAPALEARSFHDAALGLGVCGDWCAAPRVEGAFLSGAHLAERVAAHLGV